LTEGIIDVDNCKYSHSIKNRKSNKKVTQKTKIKTRRTLKINRTKTNIKVFKKKLKKNKSIKNPSTLQPEI